MGTPVLIAPDLTAVRIGRHPVKLTAILYLKQALLEERYEDCPDIIMIAREFGADPYEIRNILEDPRRKPQ